MEAFVADLVFTFHLQFCSKYIPIYGPENGDEGSIQARDDQLLSFSVCCMCVFFSNETFNSACQEQCNGLGNRLGYLMFPLVSLANKLIRCNPFLDQEGSFGEERCSVGFSFSLIFDGFIQINLFLQTPQSSLRFSFPSHILSLFPVFLTLPYLIFLLKSPYLCKPTSTYVHF